ncbi:DUF6681 family protein [Loigolactobacillus zhaoyuanensis]|uniref:DUF6681 family protein n=1 Tax=Loigolactobacillus zhaoyuanensis TaxID=2486017 RepID=A0ABW8UDE7_9LACO|nr:DUF6681 family protein [Loigolactobacillus zhaoyuanensis]
MLSLLDMLNHYLGYFNMNVKLKNRVYTAIGIAGVIYLGYLAINFIRLGAWTRGILFLLIFLVLVYFVTLNVIYYFTTKTAKFDISPKIEKVLGGRPAGAADDPMLGGKHTAQATKVMPAAGLFHEQSLLPAKLTVDASQQANIEQVVDGLVASNYLQLDYAGHSDEQIYQAAQASGQPVYAVGEGVQLPFYELREAQGRYLVYAGRNAIDSLPVGEVTEVGLMPTKQAAAKYQIVLASAQLTGGPNKIAGRSGAVAGSAPFQLIVQVAYKDPNATVTSTPVDSSATNMGPRATTATESSESTRMSRRNR